MAVVELSLRIFFDVEGVWMCPDDEKHGNGLYSSFAVACDLHLCGISFPDFNLS